MTITDTDREQTVPPVQQPRAASLAVRIRLFLVSVFGLLALGLLAPAPAHAATTPAYSPTTICIKAPYVLYGTTYWGPYNRPVRLDVWINGAAYVAQTYTPGLNGCLTVNLIPGHYWRFRVYHHESGLYYIGHSSWLNPVHGVRYTFPTLRLATSPG